MSVKILVLYYSMFGNTYLMAKATAEGIKEASASPILRTVPELLPQEIIENDARIKKAKELQKDVNIIKLEELEDIDGLILGSPTRFGNICAQLRSFLDQTGPLWAKGALINKPAGVFCCTASLHGGQETTLISMMLTLMHHGCIIVGLPYSVKELLETKTGGTPYGPSAVVGHNAENPPLESDLKMAYELGKRVSSLALSLKRI